MVTIILSYVGIVVSLPLGVVLALGRRSTLPIVKVLSVVFIEFVRGVPLITVLFMANTMLPLFVPGRKIDDFRCALVGVALFASAYMAEVIRGGLQAIPKGQYEGAMSLGLGYGQMMRLIILPQALQIVIPGIVNTFIGLFKDTTLVSIVGIFDLLGTIAATSPIRPGRRRRRRDGLVFAASILAVLLRHVALFDLRGATARHRPPQVKKETSMAIENAVSAEEIEVDADKLQISDTEVAVEMVGINKWYGEFHVLQGHQPEGDARRAHRDLRPVGLRQVDDDPLHQPAGRAPEGPDHRRRHGADQRSEEDRRDPPRGRHGVPALQPVPAPDHPRELHAGADLGAQDAQEGGRGDRDALS